MISVYASVQMLMGPITHWSVGRLRELVKDFKKSENKSEQEIKHKALDREAVMIGSYMACLEVDIEGCQKVMLRQTKQINRLRDKHTINVRELEEARAEATKFAEEFLKLRRELRKYGN